ncbi:helix-turn-helix transcriptional regulator [Sphingobacterium sp.]|uniref:helix-turn-helix domain-containing protein n=1 Tax=Sphingobacterium sp. TaxID=341027 RepID=UPI0028A13C5F|nr:helix-turn-helix transcriptional regulator [Sphingobacterium sp.]
MYAGSIVKKIRQGLDVNQDEMARVLEISQSYYSSIENGKKPISDKLINTYRNKLGILIVKDSSVNRDGSISEKVGGIKIDIHGGISDKYFDKVEKFKDQSLGDKEVIHTEIKESQTRDDKYANAINNNIDLPVYLSINITTKLIKDIQAMNNEITRISDAIDTFTSLENVMIGIEDTYLSEITITKLNTLKYYDGKRFDYLEYKEAVVKEYEKCLKFLPALERFGKAIEDFYKEFSKVDSMNVINDFSFKNFSNKKE